MEWDTINIQNVGTPYECLLYIFVSLDSYEFTGYYFLSAQCALPQLVPKF